MLQAACATILYPFFLKEREHQRLPNVIYRKREMVYRVTCGAVLF